MRTQDSHDSHSAAPQHQQSKGEPYVCVCTALRRQATGGDSGTPRCPSMSAVQSRSAQRAFCRALPKGHFAQGRSLCLPLSIPCPAPTLASFMSSVQPQVV